MENAITKINELSVSSLFEVIYTQENLLKLEVVTEPAYEDFVKISSANGKLDIKLITHANMMLQLSKNKIKVYISSPDLNKIFLSNGASFSTSRLLADNLELKISGQSNASIEHLNFNIMNLEASGQSEFKVGQGQCNNINLCVSGQSRIVANKLESKKSEVHISGMSVAYMCAEKIHGNISGMSQLHINSNSDCSVKKSGNSTVITGYEHKNNKDKKKYNSDMKSSLEIDVLSNFNKKIEKKMKNIFNNCSFDNNKINIQEERFNEMLKENDSLSQKDSLNEIELLKKINEIQKPLQVSEKKDNSKKSFKKFW